MALLKSSISGEFASLCGSFECDPLSPPVGEAAQGEHPLTPFFVTNVFRSTFPPERPPQGGNAHIVRTFL